MGIETGLGSSVFTDALDNIVNWARKNSFSLYPFVNDCCAAGMPGLYSGIRADTAFGTEGGRFSPRQADVLLVAGTVNAKSAAALKKIYCQMCEPKWVIAVGSCAVSGGIYGGCPGITGADKIIPVDVYVPGCPPGTESVIAALDRLRLSIAEESVLDGKYR